MEPWIILSIAAAAFQTMRFMLQKHLSMGPLSAGGATLARFVYSVPFILTLTAVYLAAKGVALPGLTPIFWGYAVMGGLSQILATWCLVALFAQRNFAVGITLKKTEIVQTAAVGLLILGDRTTAVGIGAILLGLVGVLILSKTPGLEGQGWRRLGSSAVKLGLTSGAFFAVSAVSYRGATLAIESVDPLLRAGLSLAVVTVMQAIALSLWLMLREPGQVTG